MGYGTSKVCNAGRVRRFLEDPERSFGIILKNAGEQSELFLDIADNRWGFIELMASWREKEKGMGEESEAGVPAFLVKGATRDDLVKLGARHGQNSVLHKHRDGIEFISTSLEIEKPPLGAVLKRFKLNADGNIAAAGFEAIRKYFFRMAGGGRHSKKASFGLKEKVERSWMERMGRLETHWVTAYEDDPKDF